MKTKKRLCTAALTGLASFAVMALPAVTTAPSSVAFAQGEEDMMEEQAPPAEAPPPRQRTSRSNIKRLFQVIKAEPTIRDVQKATLSYRRLHPDHINALARNARLKGLMPSVSASFSNEIGNRFSNTKDGLFPVLPNPSSNPNPNFYKERVAESTDQLQWSVSASWELDRLVFAAEALDAKSLTSMEEALVREITTLYFSRRRVLASIILSPPDDDEEFFYELMRLDELTSTIDSFTGGKFAKKAWDWETELMGGASD